MRSPAVPAVCTLLTNRTSVAVRFHQKAPLWSNTVSSASSAVCVVTAGAARGVENWVSEPVNMLHPVLVPSKTPSKSGSILFPDW